MCNYILLTIACLVGIAVAGLCVELHDERRQRRLLEQDMATVRAAAECVARLNANVNQRADEFRAGRQE